MIKILIAGSNGFLGSNLVNFFLKSSEYSVFSTSQKPSVNFGLNNFYQGDLRNQIFLRDLFIAIKPDVVINTVSLVNVDQCEDQPQLAYDLTVQTAENLAQTAKNEGCRIIYISTDHLFEGTHAYYSEDDTPSPVNQYGKTKLLAERKIRETDPNSAIIRTNFFGWSPHNHQPTFGEWVYNNLKDRRPMTLFTNYYFTPIEVNYLAESIERIIQSNFCGIINVAGSERCSKYEFGARLAKLAGFDDSEITPAAVNSSSFKAPRQPDLSLSVKKYETIFHKPLPDLNTSLKRFLSTKPV